MSATGMRSVLPSRRLAAVAYVLFVSAVVFAQSDGADDSFQPRFPPGGKSGPREKVIRIQCELARLREEAPPVETCFPHTEEMTRLAREIAVSGRVSETLEQSRLIRFVISTSPERLTLPARQLNYLECHAAADLYGTLFELVRDDRQVRFGFKAVEYLKQYVKLAQVREELLDKLEAEGILRKFERTADFRKVETRHLQVLEYHKGYYCGHLVSRNRHGYLTFLFGPEGDLKRATRPLAARIVQDAMGRPETPYAAAEFLREVLRVFPHENKVIESARDIPPPDLGRFGKENAERKRAEWEKFVQGVGRSITPPRREYTDAGETFTVFVYWRCGGSVIRYRLQCDTAGAVQIQKEEIAWKVGDCWFIR